MSEPRIYTVAEWGAQPVDTRRLSQRPAAGIVVHHTAGGNTHVGDDEDVERALAFALARQIQRDHLARGWKDSGQHFTVTRSGLILEGRHGSLATARRGLVIRGSHAGRDEINATWWGIECAGNTELKSLTDPQWASLVELCAWLCIAGGVDSANIKGHREFKNTVCPGVWLFSQLPRLRQEVHTLKLVMTG